MATYTIMMIAAIMFAQAVCRPEITRNNIGGIVNPPASLSYDELLYILEARHGGADLKEKPRILSPCARAILGCCKDNEMNESCSESLRCGAFFFDDNPCEEKFVTDALKAAKRFYQQLQD